MLARSVTNPTGTSTGSNWEACSELGFQVIEFSKKYIGSLNRPNRNGDGEMPDLGCVIHSLIHRSLFTVLASFASLNPTDRRLFYHPCFATRLGGVSGGKETQGWRDSSHTAMAGAGKFGSAKLPSYNAPRARHRCESPDQPPIPGLRYAGAVSVLQSHQRSCAGDGSAIEVRPAGVHGTAGRSWAHAGGRSAELRT